MSIHSLAARLRRIEAAQHVGAPRFFVVVADRLLEDMEASEALANWRHQVTAGQASVTGAVLYPMKPDAPTVAEWAARHVTAH